MYILAGSEGRGVQVRLANFLSTQPMALDKGLTFLAEARHGPTRRPLLAFSSQAYHSIKHASRRTRCQPRYEPGLLDDQGTLAGPRRRKHAHSAGCLPLRAQRSSGVRALHLRLLLDGYAPLRSPGASRSPCWRRAVAVTQERHTEAVVQAHQPRPRRAQTPRSIRLPTKRTIPP